MGELLSGTVNELRARVILHRIEAVPELWAAQMSEHGGLHICRFYFPLEQIVFSKVLASEKFSPSLGGEEGFKSGTTAIVIWV